MPISFLRKIQRPKYKQSKWNISLALQNKPISSKISKLLAASYLLIATLISFTFVRKDFLYLGHCNFFQYLVKRGKENL